MILAAAEELRRQGKEHRTLHLYGQEKNLTTSAIARMNLFLHGIEDFDIVRGDTLAHSAFTDGDRLRRFDVVLANPPYSIKVWERAAWSADPWGRNRYGTPPQGRADYAFWQHILASMDTKTGRCAGHFPRGVLFREEDRDMRTLPPAPGSGPRPVPLAGVCASIAEKHAASLDQRNGNASMMGSLARSRAQWLSFPRMAS